MNFIQVTVIHGAEPGGETLRGRVDKAIETWQTRNGIVISSGKSEARQIDSMLFGKIPASKRLIEEESVSTITNIKNVYDMVFDDKFLDRYSVRKDDIELSWVSSEWHTRMKIYARAKGFEFIPAPDYSHPDVLSFNKRREKLAVLLDSPTYFMPMGIYPIYQKFVKSGFKQYFNRRHADEMKELDRKDKVIK